MVYYRTMGNEGQFRFRHSIGHGDGNKARRLERARDAHLVQRPQSGEEYPRMLLQSFTGPEVEDIKAQFDALSRRHPEASAREARLALVAEKDRDSFRRAMAVVDMVKAAGRELADLDRAFVWGKTFPDGITRENKPALKYLE